MVEKTSRLDYRKHRDNIVAACKTFLYFGFILCIACYILISVLGIYYPITNAIDKNNSNICYIYSGLYEWITEKSETLNQTTTSLTLSTNGVIIISVFVFSLAFTLTGLIMYRVCAIDLSRRADKIIISMIRVILITNVSLIVLLFAAFPFLTTTSGQFPSNLRTWMKSGLPKWSDPVSIDKQTWEVGGFILIVLSSLSAIAVFLLLVVALIKSYVKPVKYPE